MNADEKRGAEYLGAEWSEDRAAWLYHTAGDQIFRGALTSEMQDLGRRLAQAYEAWFDSTPERWVR